MNNCMSLVLFRKRSLAVVSRRFLDRILIVRAIREILIERLPGILYSFAYRTIEANRATILAIDSIEIFQMVMELQHRRTWDLRLQDNGMSIWVKE